jgi:hypothetical protein
VIRSGTHVEVGLGCDRVETGTVMRWLKYMGPRDAIPGYHPIRFDLDGAKLMVHERGLRVIDNRADRVTAALETLA